jgi:hypothetical protein
MPAKNSSAKTAAKPAPAAAKTAPARVPAKAPAKTVKISKPSSDNQAIVTRKAPRTAPVLPVLPISERARLVAEAAYFLSEKRGFDPAGAEADWFAAESQVDGSYQFT